MTSHRKPIHTIMVSVTGYGEATFSHVSPSAAFAAAWRSFRSARDCTFKEFMSMASKLHIPNPPGVGDPIRVSGRNAWVIEPHHHSPAFVYDGERVVLRAHHSDVERGHSEANGRADT
jgi:hypothetical protein